LGDNNGGPFAGCEGCLTASGFFSQLLSEDCIVAVVEDEGLECCGVVGVTMLDKDSLLI
jgi:hypothetical protein